MGVTPTYNMDAIRKKLEKDLITISNIIIMRLTNLGEKAINHARLIPHDIGYTNRTGALRASTGYVVYAQGKAIVSNFKGGNPVGLETGLTLANEIGSKYTTGWVLIVVAGMNYAVYVESANRDVLTSTEQLVTVELPKILKELEKKFSKI